MRKIIYLLVLFLIPFALFFTACDSNGGKIQIEVFIDNQKVDTVYTNSSLGYMIDIPQKPQDDITTNPNSERYFYGWFLDVGFNIPLTIDTKFTQDSKIYGKWIDAYSNDFNYSVSEGVATITAFDNLYDSTVVVIPRYINSFPVEAIDSSAFANQKKLRHVVICNSIQTIGASAFSGCSSLQSIILPRDLKVIENNLFYNCALLSSIDLPNGVEQIKSNAFYGCKNLTNVIIPSATTSIAIDAFVKCENLNISIDENNSVYDSRQNCNAIIETSTNTLIIGNAKSFIPNTIENIGNSAFSGCTNLTNVNIPHFVINIGDKAFSNCTNLSKVFIADSVITIGQFAFYNCVNLVNIKLSSRLENVGSSAFQGCESLLTIIIPQSVTTINNKAFYKCGSATIYCENDTKPMGYVSGWDLSDNRGSNNTAIYHTVYWFRGNQPTYYGNNANYWRYVNGVPTIWS